MVKRRFRDWFSKNNINEEKCNRSTVEDHISSENVTLEEKSSEKVNLKEQDDERVAIELKEEDILEMLKEDMNEKDTDDENLENEEKPIEKSEDNTKVEEIRLDKDKCNLNLEESVYEDEKEELKIEEPIMKVLSYERYMRPMTTSIDINSTLQDTLKAKYPDKEYDTAEDMKSLTGILDLSDSDIKVDDQGRAPFVGLEYATEIDGLKVNNNTTALGNVDLSALTWIYEVYLDNSGVTSVTVVTTDGLDVLSLDNNPNISTANLPKIYGGIAPEYDDAGLLSLNSCNISDLSFLRTNTGIGTLKINDNKIIDLTPILSLTNLINLEADNNRIVVIPDLSALEKFYAISLDGNYIQDISPLDGVGELINLNIANPYNGISIVEQEIVISEGQETLNLTNLIKDLNGDIPDNIINIRPDGEYSKPTITWSNIIPSSVLSFEFDNGTLDGDTFKGSYFTGTVTETEMIDFTGNEVLETKLNELLGSTRQADQRITKAELANLTETVDLSNMDPKLTDIEQLKYLTNVTEINLSDNSISDLTSLSGLTKLTNLDLSNNQISNINQLASLSNLTTINLNQNKILDFRILFGIQSLTTVNIDNQTPDNQYIRLTSDGKLIIDINKLIPGTNGVTGQGIYDINPDDGIFDENLLTITWQNAKVGQVYSFNYEVTVEGQTMNTKVYSENIMTPFAIGTVTTSGVINIKAEASVTRGVKLF